MIDRVLALAMLLVGAIYLTQAVRMPLGTTAQPGPGFYPTLVGAFACVVALVIVALAVRRSCGDEPATREAEPENRRGVALAIVTLAGFCLLMPWVGYPMAALLFVGVMLRQLGAGWGGALITAVLSAEGSYYLFAGLLGVTLPRGYWPH